MAFADNVLKPGWTTAFRFDVYVGGDVAYRYGTVSGGLNPGDTTQMYDGCILNISTLDRGFGQQRVAAASQMTVLLANTNNARDWLVDRDSYDDINSCRWQLYCVIQSPDGATTEAKLLGKYVVADQPRRNAGRVQVLLADDFLGALSDPVLLPTYRDWKDAPDSDTTNCPILKPYEDRPAMSWYNPSTQISGTDVYLSPQPPDILETTVQLAFGEDWIECGTYFNCHPVCCVQTSTAPVIFNGVSGEQLENKLIVRVERPDGTLEVIPRLDGFARTETYELRVSDKVTVGGRDFFIVYLVGDPNGTGTFYGFSSEKYPSRVWVKGVPLSELTFRELRVAGLDDNQQRGVNVLTDLIGNYSGLGASVIDTYSFVRASANSPQSFVSGTLGYKIDAEGGDVLGVSLRDAVTGICQSNDWDIFLKWDGTVALSTDWNDFAAFTETQYQIAEEDISDFEDWIPGEGERHAPCNSIFLTGAKRNDAERQSRKFQGPFTRQDLVDAYGGNIKTLSLNQGWKPYSRQSQDPWQYRGFRAGVRPRCSFKVPLGVGMQLELGMFVNFSATRGGTGSIYALASWQVERLSLDFSGMVVEVECVWSDDLFTPPFLVDNESLYLRATGNSLRTATVENAIDTVTFSSGSLISDGVAAGDILLLEDDTPGIAANDFRRWRGLAIGSVDSATQVTLSDSDYNFGAASPVAVSSWRIIRGAATLPSDLVNYPSGNDMYGTVVPNLISATRSNPLSSG